MRLGAEPTVCQQENDRAVGVADCVVAATWSDRLDTLTQCGAGPGFSNPATGQPAADGRRGPGEAVVPVRR